MTLYNKWVFKGLLHTKIIIIIHYKGFHEAPFLDITHQDRCTILDITHRTHAAYALLHPPQCKDTEERTLLAFGGYSPKWRYWWRGETEGRRFVEKSHYFYFLCIQKVFSSLHKILIESLMADGLPWRCFSILFWTSTVLFTWQSMGQSQASRFLTKIS